MQSGRPFVVHRPWVVSACGDDAHPTPLAAVRRSGFFPSSSGVNSPELESRVGRSGSDFGSVEVGPGCQNIPDLQREVQHRSTLKERTAPPDGFSAYWDYEYWGDTIPKGRVHTDGYSSFVPRGGRALRSVLIVD